VEERKTGIKRESIFPLEKQGMEWKKKKSLILMGGGKKGEEKVTASPANRSRKDLVPITLLFISLGGRRTKKGREIDMTSASLRKREKREEGGGIFPPLRRSGKRELHLPSAIEDGREEKLVKGKTAPILYEEEKGGEGGKKERNGNTPKIKLLYNLVDVSAREETDQTAA